MCFCRKFNIGSSTTTNIHEYIRCNSWNWKCEKCSVDRFDSSIYFLNIVNDMRTRFIRLLPAFFASLAQYWTELLEWEQKNRFIQTLLDLIFEFVRFSFFIFVALSRVVFYVQTFPLQFRFQFSFDSRPYPFSFEISVQ